MFAILVHHLQIYFSWWYIENLYVKFSSLHMGPSHFMEFWLLLPHCRNYLSLGHSECLSTCMSLLFCHCIAVKSALVLTRMSPFSLLLFLVLGLVECLSYSAWNCHNSKYISSPSHQISQGKKEIVCLQFVNTSFCLSWQFCHCSFVAVTCCAMCCLSYPRYTFMLYVYPIIYIFHILCVSIWITEFENVDAEMFAVLWYVLFGNHSPFDGNYNFVDGHIFRSVIEFESYI
jgi:hypothetical protein